MGTLRRMWALIRTGLLGVAGYVFPRILIGLGVPLDAWAVKLGAHLSQSWTRDDAVAWLCFLGAVASIAIGSQWERIVGAVSSGSETAPRSNKEDLALTPPQEKLLALLSESQRQFATSKLIIDRQTGRLHFDDNRQRGDGTNLIRDLYGAGEPTDVARFEMLLESLPAKFLRVLAEARWDNPFVVSVTEAGSSYLRHRATTALPAQTPLKIVYSHDSPKCVRRSVREDGKTSTRYWVGVHNATTDRTLYDVSLRVLESQFAAVLAFVHGRIRSPYWSSAVRFEREPILAEWKQLDPDVTEYVELIGLSDERPANPTDELDKILTTPHEFALEARATDTKRTVALLEYTPEGVPAIKWR